mmetsp:Transcript_1748/g.3742  ORF Transcript_1748/g.3742 Transcript_1748/m.3742 type:complete len:123 (-) Transcript_1748:157-525(-)
MNSLHARRPPKLEQGDLRRNKQRGVASHTPIKGGGSLRRPPNAAGIDVSVGSGGNGGGNGTKKRFCSFWRMTTSVLVVILLTFLFMQIRGLFGAWVMKSSGSGLRSNQNSETTNENADMKLG